jgi:hypothetical protein
MSDNKPKAKQIFPKDMGSTESPVTDKDRDQIMRYFLLSVPTAKKRSMVMRLSTIIAEGDRDSDEFYAAIMHFSNPNNERKFYAMYSMLAHGGTTGLEFDEDPEFSDFLDRYGKHLEKESKRDQRKARPSRRKRRGERS